MTAIERLMTNDLEAYYRNDRRHDALMDVRSLFPPADDHAPPDAAWWRAAGLVDPRDDEAPDLNHYGAGTLAFVTPPHADTGVSRFGVMRCDSAPEFWAYLLAADGFDGSQDCVCPLPTRGHARRFFAAIGHPLKEPAKT